MRCDRCGSGLIAGRTECHICGTPVEANAAKPAAPASAPVPIAGDPSLAPPEIEAGIPGITMQRADDLLPQPTLAGGMRVSLTGEILEAAPPPMPRQPTAAAGIPPRAGTRPASPGPTRSPSHTRPMVQEAPKSGSPIALILVIVLVLAGGGGAAGYWFWNQKQAPGRAVSKLLDEVKAGRWKEAFMQVHLSEEQEKMISAAGGKEALFALQAAAFTKSGVKLVDYKITESTADGDSANVKVWQKVEVGGTTKESTQTVTVKKYDGEWKIDASAAGGGMGLGGSLSGS